MSLPLFPTLPKSYFLFTQIEASSDVEKSMQTPSQTFLDDPEPSNTFNPRTDWHNKCFQAWLGSRGYNFEDSVGPCRTSVGRWAIECPKKKVETLFSHHAIPKIMSNRISEVSYDPIWWKLDSAPPYGQYDARGAP